MFFQNFEMGLGNFPLKMYRGRKVLELSEIDKSAKILFLSTVEKTLVPFSRLRRYFLIVLCSLLYLSLVLKINLIKRRRTCSLSSRSRF